MKAPLFGLLAVTALLAAVAGKGPEAAQPPAGVESSAAAATDKTPDGVETTPITPSPLPTPRPIAPFVQKGIDWLVRAQHPNGGWGGGSHANQQIRDPHKVVTDPATTAVAGIALIRAGHTPVAGTYAQSVRRAAEHLCGVVEEASEGPRITDLTGTQPQAKLGQFADTALAVQFFSRLLIEIPEGSPLRERVDAALDKCLAKLEGSQQTDGSWGGGGWAPVLQSSLGCQALELAIVGGKKIDPRALEGARGYQTANFDVDTGRADASAAAGVELYALGASNRAAASRARAAQQVVDEAKKEGKLPADAPVDAVSFRALGYTEAAATELASAVTANEAQIRRLDDEAMLRGFGSNGGEEFLSYLLTSEALVLAGGEKFREWNEKMHQRLAKIQTSDGSWTGHHCITSPVFCTAAVVQCLTVDRDAELLAEIAEHDIETLRRK